jgi:dTDP-4-dehydrorhamnose 3,5-epimerase
MKAHLTELADVLLLEPTVFADSRGWFFESWNAEAFNAAIGTAVEFVQDNHSLSSKGVLRGLHYQVAPHAQGKLVRVVAGSVLDVVVDIRKGSKTFKRWKAFELTAENKYQLWIPAGFAHGFLSLADNTELCYKVTDYYDRACDRSIVWNDPELDIDWGLGKSIPSLSDKDGSAPALASSEVFDN